MSDPVSLAKDNHTPCNQKDDQTSGTHGCRYFPLYKRFVASVVGCMLIALTGTLSFIHAVICCFIDKSQTFIASGLIIATATCFVAALAWIIGIATISDNWRKEIHGDK